MALGKDGANFIQPAVWFGILLILDASTALVWVTTRPYFSWMGVY